MIIGYGFRDTHINEVLVRSVMEHGVAYQANSRGDRSRAGAQQISRLCIPFVV